MSFTGETQTSEVLDGGTFGWLNGEWFVPEEAADPAAECWVWVLQGDTVNEFHLANGIADFDVSQSADKWEGWRPPSTPKSSLHTIGGVLTLSSMYSFPKGRGAPTNSSLPPGNVIIPLLQMQSAQGLRIFGDYWSCPVIQLDFWSGVGWFAYNMFHFR